MAANEQENPFDDITDAEALEQLRSLDAHRPDEKLVAEVARLREALDSLCGAVDTFRKEKRPATTEAMAACFEMDCAVAKARELLAGKVVTDEQRTEEGEAADVDAIRERAEAIANSAEGRRKILESAREANDAVRELQEARRIKPGTMQRRIGPADGSGDWSKSRRPAMTRDEVDALCDDTPASGEGDDWHGLWIRLQAHEGLTEWELKPTPTTDALVMPGAKRILLGTEAENVCRLLIHEVAHAITGCPAPGHTEKWLLCYARLLCVHLNCEGITRSDLIAYNATCGHRDHFTGVEAGKASEHYTTREEDNLASYELIGKQRPRARVCCGQCGEPIPIGGYPKSICDDNRERAMAGKPPIWGVVYIRCEKCGENAIRPRGNMPT